MRNIKSIAKDAVKLTLRYAGLTILRSPSSGELSAYDYEKRADLICRKHWNQSKEKALELRAKYESPIFGTVRVWDLIEMLGQVIDSGDRTLYTTSQLIHVLQILDQMKRDGITDPDLILSGLIHDVGKVAVLAGEAPEHVFGGHHRPISPDETDIGLDNCLFQWDHGELAYTRFKDHVPDHVAWLIRYHMIVEADCRPYMDDRDRLYTEKYLRPFVKYDVHSKSPFYVPTVALAEYRDLIEAAFPKPISF